MDKRKVFTYEYSPVGPFELPDIKKDSDARIRIFLDPLGDVNIEGNSKGLLYLASRLAAMGLHESRDGYHIHLSADEGHFDYDKNDEGAVSEVTIYNIDFDS